MAGTATGAAGRATAGAVTGAGSAAAGVAADEGSDLEPESVRWITEPEADDGACVMLTWKLTLGAVTPGTTEGFAVTTGALAGCWAVPLGSSTVT